MVCCDQDNVLVMVTPRRVILSVGCNSLFIKWSRGVILASFPADDHLLFFAGIDCNTPTVCPRFDFIQVTLEAFCTYDSISRILNGNMDCRIISK